MKKVMVGVAAFVMAVSLCLTARADLVWGFTGNLLDFDANVQVGWHVQMFHDVGANSVLSSITAFSDYQSPVGTGTADDQLLLSFSTTVGSNKGDPPYYWGVPFSSWGALENQSVYSVLYNHANPASASQAVVIDGSPFVLPGSDPAEYTITSVANSWVAIPEPTTLAFLGLGVAAFLIRRKMRK